jgi:anti-anti-sigma factor
VSALEAVEARLPSPAKTGGRHAPAPLMMPFLEAYAEIGSRAMVTVHVRGELDLATADRLRDFVLDLMTRFSPRVVLDLSGLAFCDPYGLSALRRIANDAEGAGGGLTLTAVPPFFTRLLHITQLEDRFLVPAGGARMP